MEHYHVVRQYPELSEDARRDIHQSSVRSKITGLKTLYKGTDVAQAQSKVLNTEGLLEWISCVTVGNRIEYQCSLFENRMRISKDTANIPLRDLEVLVNVSEDDSKRA